MSVKPRTLSREAQSRILAVRVGRLGDMVMLTPALRALLDAYPDSEIHLLSSPEGRLVLGDFDPRITQTLVYDRNTIRGFAARRRVRTRLRRTPYSQAFLFETHPHYRELLSDLSGPVHVLPQRDRVVHFARRCIDLVTDVTRADPGPGWVQLPVSEQGERDAAALLSAAGIDDTTVVVGLHPSSWLLTRARRFLYPRRLRHQVWPATYFAALARNVGRWAQDNSVNVRLIVDVLPNERRVGETVRDLSGGAVTLFSAPPDFERYKAVLRRMDLLVTVNTGSMHLAAAMGTPLVALHSLREPEDCGPYMPPDRFATIRADEMPDPELGMAAIPPTRVFEECLPFLRAAAESCGRGEQGGATR